MKKVLFFSIVCLIVAFISESMFAQVVTIDPLKAKCGMDIYQGSSSIFSHGLCYNSESTSYSFRVGREPSIKERAILQWEIPDGIIPDGSTVTSVTLTLTYSKITTDLQPLLELFNVGIDIENSPNLSNLWTNTDPVDITGIAMTENFTKEYSNITGTFQAGSGFARAIEASLAGNKFTLGMAWKDEKNQQVPEGQEWYLSSRAYLQITYEPAKQQFTVDQRLSNNNSYGYIGIHNGTDFQEYLAPYIFYPYVNSVQYIRADTNKATVADEKFNFWKDNTDVINHKTLTIVKDIPPLTANFRPIGTATVRNALEGLSSVSADNISFKDPWMRDDNSDPKGLRNRGSGAIWHSYSSPFVQDIGSTKFKGVLLDQQRNGTNPNYYSVLAPYSFDKYLSQTGKTHRFNFIDWSSTNATVSYPMVTETPVIFTANNAEVKANYKASMLSGTQSAFSNSSQRKFIRTPNDGYYHIVYESMGKIWYERSTDNGTTWTIGNNGKPLNNDYVYNKTTGQTTGTGSYTTAKHPSIDYYQNFAVVAWQEQSGSNYVVRLCFISNGVPVRSENDIPFTSYGLYSEDIYPEIAVKDDSHAVIAIRRNDSILKGLEVHLLLLNPGGGTSQESSSGRIPGTDQNTGLFTIATDRSSTDKYHIAWQQNVSSTTGSMMYSRLNFIYEPGGAYAPARTGSSENPALIPGDGGSWVLNIVKNVTVSNYTPYETFYSPSMIGATDGTARLSFKGHVETGSYSIATTNPDNLGWIPYLNKYGGETFSPQISQGTETYFVGWTELTGGVYRTIATDASTLRNMETINGSLGRDMQINPGGARSQQFSMSFNSEATALPYFFTRSSEAIGMIVAKKLAIKTGRGIFLTKDESQMYFILGNVTSEGTPVDFIPSQDTVRLDGDLKKVNSFMATKPFSLKDNSTLSFAVIYGSKDSAASKSGIKEGQFASFKVDLVDDATGRVIGSYMDEKMDKTNIYGQKEGVFKVNSNGIGNKLVRLRVSVDENMKSEYTISDMFFGEGLPLSKSLKEKEMGLEGSMEVKEYALSQNYPNPFNPTTMISYALPRASKVSLKVYDILGKEVATLVNGYMEIGKYSVEFNASALPSGIYIYEIRANDFVKSGKMMLLK